MKHAQDVQWSAAAILERIQLEYAGLLKSAPLSLERLFSPESFRFDAFCRGYRPHPRAEGLRKDAEAFGQRYGTWLTNSRHYISCAWYLYPTADFDRVLTITKNLSLGFYLNDVMGRDVFKSLSPDKQHSSRKMIENMAFLDETLRVAPDAHPLETANAEILSEFRDNSPRDWFRRFLRLYCHHLDITHKDSNADTLGYIPDVYAYTDNRCHYAAVHHLVLWIEYSTGQFLEWDLLKANNLAQKLQRLHWVTAAFPALANDLFSFEYEVIDNGCDSNLVMIIALNNPEWSLSEVIGEASGIVRNLVGEITSLLAAMNIEAGRLKRVHPALARKLAIHLEGIERFVQASWLWQAHTKRYKRPQSLWMETMLAEKAAAPVA